MTVDEVRAERCIVGPPFYDAIDNEAYIEFLEKVLREIATMPAEYPGDAIIMRALARAAIGDDDDEIR